MEIKGKDRCFICDREVDWEAHITKYGSTQKNVQGNKAQARAVAVGRSPVSSTSPVKYDIYVKCKHCGNENKFKY